MGVITFVAAEAIRENAVRVEFSEVVHLSGLLEPKDASLVSHWAVTPDASTTGMAGDVARAVGVVRVEFADERDGVADADYGRFVNLYLDRPLTPFPASYELAWTDVWADGLATSTTGASSFYGTYRVLTEPSLEAGRTSRDFAAPADPYSVGGFGVDVTGDYAFDEGMACLRKRIIRRLTTRKGAFVHLPNYGVGVPGELKRLASSETLSRLKGEAEAQIAEEPDVLLVKVSVQVDPDVPSLIRFRVAVQPKIGKPVAFTVPFDLAA